METLKHGTKMHIKFMREINKLEVNHRVENRNKRYRSEVDAPKLCSSGIVLAFHRIQHYSYKQHGKKRKGKKNWNSMSHAHTTDMGVKSLNLDSVLKV